MPRISSEAYSGESRYLDYVGEDSGDAGRDLTEVGEFLKGWVENNAPLVAKAVFGNGPVGGAHMTKDEFKAFVRRGWSDPAFRERLRMRVGPVAFVNIAEDALNDPDPLELRRAEGTRIGRAIAAVRGTIRSAAGLLGR